MANQWFKFYGGEYLSDPKILQLTAQERSCWVTLLCLANQSENGVVKFLSEKQLLALSGITEPLHNILEKFKDLEMIRICNGVVTIKNWEKRQMSESYSRVKNFRKRQSNANDNDRREEKRIEENKKEIELPIWINKNAWNAWVQYRKEKKKTLTPTSIKLQLKFLEENQKDHAQIIKNSITNGWTGLFALKDESKGNKRTPPRLTEPNTSKEDNDRRNFLDKQSRDLASNMSVN